MTDCEHEYHWYPAPNENGWKCCLCDYQPGEPTGFSPQLDRDLIQTKVFGILQDLSMANIVYVSNSSHGDSLVGIVAKRCRTEDTYDQYSIALWLLEAMTESHAVYWKKIGEGVVTGKDPRERCHCGALATRFSGKSATCREHPDDHLF